MRLFIAICFDENMLDSLVEIQDDLVRSGVKGNYTPRENLHMTLAFIGEYDDPEQIEEVMKNVPLRSFSVKLSGYQPFKDMFFANLDNLGFGLILGVLLALGIISLSVIWYFMSDKRTGAPITGYDAKTGKPIYAKPKGFDPTTGKPIYEE